MYEHINSKHHHVEAACLRFTELENVEKVAVQCGMSGQMLRNKLNPNQPHQLTVKDLVLITKFTSNDDIINGTIRELGLNVVCLPKATGSKPLAHSAMNVAAATGDISRHIIEAESDRRLTRVKKDQIVKKAQQAVRELVFLMSDVENRCGGAGPFVSMCADAVLSGLPMPGM